MDNLSTNMQSLFIKHYKTLLRKIKENLGKWRDNYLGGSEDYMFLKVSLHPKLIYK